MSKIIEQYVDENPMLKSNIKFRDGIEVIIAVDLFHYIIHSWRMHVLIAVLCLVVRQTTMTSKSSPRCIVESFPQHNIDYKVHPTNMHTVRTLMCFVVVCYHSIWSITFLITSLVME